MKYLITLPDGSQRTTDADNFHTYLRLKGNRVGSTFESRREQLKNYLNTTVKDWEMIDE